MKGITNAAKSINSPASKEYVDTQDVAAKNEAIATSKTYTDSRKGYDVVMQSSSIFTAEWNKEYRLSSAVSSGTITLPATPDFTADDAQTCEVRVIVKFASTVSSFAFAPASGQSIKWPDDQPTWTSMGGKLFEISLSPIYSDGTYTYVVAYAKEIAI